ncbi:hypothetical protein RM844_11005 [Streptomyces sp. DSM 44915]|uniref:Secreted protein n=1 Tax=Streptomyces chisholmiae TaxID=3075540 RepID=A0ABU2JPA3_9ACTN|nr:hypothetical protein [Streptomyces sp. DSM 44915]MDT0266819.1 hypothetical protein [Streptomyces sp. DSM 44915]
MNASSVRRLSRWLAAGASVAAAGVLQTGVAHGDETHHNSHNGPSVALVSTGQIDDPMEDVLEHTLNFGDGYGWH